MMTAPNLKYIVEFDLSRYSDIARMHDESIGVVGVDRLNEQIKDLAKEALCRVGRQMEETPYKSTGDGAIVAFAEAETASRFAEAMHRVAAEHNAGRTVELAKRHFRIGISTGEVIVKCEEDGGRIISTEFSGLTVSNAVRLESACKTGEVLVCSDTWADLPRDLRRLYGDEEVVTGKRDERLRAHRRSVTEPAPWEGTKPTGEPETLTDAPAPLWNLPSDNPFFTGREEKLKELHAALKPGARVALTGMPGVGKTQTAIKYTYLHRHEHTAAFLVPAETAQEIESGFSALARILDLPDKDAAETEVVVDAVKKWLVTTAGWLLILDNVEELCLLETFLPAGHAGRVLLTTRETALGGTATPVKLEELARDDAALLILRRSGRLSEEAPLTEAAAQDRDAARQIAEELGDLPLALDQAGAYVEETRITPAAYLDLYRKKKSRLLSRRGGSVSSHPDPVTLTFILALEKLQSKNPAAADLLRCCAFLAPDAIPEEVFTEGVGGLGKRLDRVVADEDAWNDTIKAALRLSLLGRNSDDHTLSIHRLLQDVVGNAMNAAEQQRWRERAVSIVSSEFPFDSDWPQHWPVCERLLPHALQCLKHSEDSGIASDAAALLFNQAGTYLWGRAQYAAAEPLMRRALAIAEQSYGPDHPEVATPLIIRALLLQDTNRMGEAEPLMRRALVIDEQNYGPDHPEVAADLNNLSQLLQATNRLTEAEPLMRRVVEIWEKSLGEDHPNVATALNNLAQLLQATNRLTEAEPLMRRGLAIEEKSRGANHPFVAIQLNNLAALLQATNRLTEAEPLMRRALAIDEKQLGPDHPNVAIDLNNLSQLLQATNRLTEAEPLMRRALTICENSLVEDHPNTVTFRQNLSTLLRKMGKER